MKDDCRSFRVAVFFSLIFIPGFLYAQLSWTLNAGTGFSSICDSAGSHERYATAAAEGNMSYGHSDSVVSLYAYAGIKPQIWLGNSSLKYIKSRYGAQYSSAYDEFSLRVSANGKRDIYIYPWGSVDYLNSSCLAGVTFPIGEDLLM